MFNEQHLATIPASVNAWLLPGLLPEGGLAFLQGASGVGKSLFAASLAAAVHQKMAVLDPEGNDQYVLWLTHPDSARLHAHYLRQAGVATAQQQLHLVDDALVQQYGNQAPEDFGHLLYDIAGCGTRLVIIDHLDHLCPAFLAMDSFIQMNFLRNLERIASHHRLAILFLHHPKKTHPLFALTNPFNRFALQLSWHPHTTRCRLLTIIKNQFGPTGTQFLLDISDEGKVTWKQLQEDQRIVCANSVKPSGRVKLDQLVQTLRAMIHEPQRACQVKQSLKDAGYSDRLIRSAARLANICVTKQGDNWWYHLENQPIPVQAT